MGKTELAHRLTLGVLLIAVLVAPTACVSQPNSAAGQERSQSHRGLPRGFSIAAALYDRDEVLDRELAWIKASGAQWVRVDFDWSVSQPRADAFDWQYLDRIVDMTQRHELRILAVISNAPEWARVRGTGQHGEPVNPESFAGFADLVTRRYAPRGVGTWEIWNEPNVVDFWEPAPNPAAYAELLRLSAAAIRRADPEAVILSGGLSPTEDRSDGSGVAPIRFLTEVYRAGAMVEVDAVAAHPYSFPELPNTANTAFARLPSIRALMVENGDAAKPVWITEFGAPTGSGTGAVSEWDQDAALRQAFARAGAWDWVGGFFVYQLSDGGVDTGDIEDNFGLLRHDLSPKPAWCGVLESFGGPVETTPPAPPTEGC